MLETVMNGSQMIIKLTCQSYNFILCWILFDKFMTVVAYIDEKHEQKIWEKASNKKSFFGAFFSRNKKKEIPFKELMMSSSMIKVEQLSLSSE